METRTKIGLSMLMATILCMGSVASFAIVSLSGPRNANDGLTGLSQDVSQGLLTRSLGSAYFPEDGTYSIRISDIFVGGWLAIGFTGNTMIYAYNDSEYIHFLPYQDWSGIESVDITAYYQLSAVLPPPNPGIIPNGGPVPIPIPPPEVPPVGSPITDPPLQNPIVIPVEKPEQMDYMTYNIILEVYAVNDKPEQVASLAPLYIQSGAVVPDYIDLASYFHDVDSSLWYSIGPSGSLIDAQISGSMMSVRVDPRATGYDHIVIYVTDGEFVVQGDLYVEVASESQNTFAEDARPTYSLNNILPSRLIYAECVDAGPFGVRVNQPTDGQWTATIDAPLDWNGNGYVTFMGISWVPIGPWPSSDECAPLAEPSVQWQQGLWMKFYAAVHTSVLAVNDAPMSMPFIPMMLSTDEDVTIYNAYDVTTLFYDVDSTLTYDVTSTLGIAIPSLDKAGMLSIVPSLNANGGDTIVITATDGEYTATANLPFYARPINDAPYAEFDGTLIQTSEDVSVAVDVSAMFGDIDSGLTYSALENSNFTVAIDQATGTATVTPSSNWNGAEALTFVADDGALATQSDAYLIVSAVNDPTVLVSNVPSMSFSEESSTTVELTAHFVDVDSRIVYSVGSVSVGLTANVAGGMLSVSSDENWNGDGSVIVTASDGQYSVWTEIDVNVLAVDDPPVATTPIGDLTVAEDGYTTIDLGERFADVDSTLAYGVAGSSTITAIVDDAGLLTISAPENWYGSETLTVTATDGATELTENVLVTFTPVNDAPVLVSRIEAASFVNGEERRIDLRVAFLDPDGEQLTYAVTTPDGIAAYVDKASGVAVITSVGNYSGTGEIVVTATDGYATTSTTMDVVVGARQTASTQSGIPAEAGYMLGGGMMVMSVLAAVGLSMYAREAGLNHSVRRRAKQTIIASA